MDYIQGEKFIKIANNQNIYYCHTHDILRFFYNPPQVPFILITHNSDHKITPDILKFIPKTLFRWFAQNVCVTDERIQSIPIGLENSEWFPEIKKIDKIQKKSTKEKILKNLLYVNHDINTNLKERMKPYTLFKYSDFATLVEGKNGENFDEYLENISSHNFVLCPEGNGTDTHRTWECLYSGTIPIEKRNLNNRFWEGSLPICFVNDWEDISADFLKSEYFRIKKNYWNLEMLNFSYWQNLIIGYADQIKT